MFEFAKKNLISQDIDVVEIYEHDDALLQRKADKIIESMGDKYLCAAVNRIQRKTPMPRLRGLADE